MRPQIKPKGAGLHFRGVPLRVRLLLVLPVETIEAALWKDILAQHRTDTVTGYQKHIPQSGMVSFTDASSNSEKTLISAAELQLVSIAIDIDESACGRERAVSK